MPRNVKTFSISLLPDFLEKVDLLAKEESRCRSDLVKDALRMYMAKKEREKLQLARLRAEVKS